MGFVAFKRSQKIAMSFLPRMTRFLPISISYKSCDNVSVDEFPKNRVRKFLLSSFCSES